VSEPIDQIDPPERTDSTEQADAAEQADAGPGRADPASGRRTAAWPVRRLVRRGALTEAGAAGAGAAGAGGAGAGAAGGPAASPAEPELDDPASLAGTADLAGTAGADLPGAGLNGHEPAGAQSFGQVGTERPAAGARGADQLPGADDGSPFGDLRGPFSDRRDAGDRRAARNTRDPGDARGSATGRGGADARETGDPGGPRGLRSTGAIGRPGGLGLAADARSAAGRPVSWPPDARRDESGRAGESSAPPAGFMSAPLRVGSELSTRLSALARLVQIGSARTGPDGISPKLIDDAGQLLARAGERLRLSSSHTVVALAGGTGSGKSSLFNRIAGADFSTVGVTRPVTRDVHACVWGVSGSGPLLEWLSVPSRYRYARASALDSGEQSMAGLVLLDLPDHDSVMSHATDQVDQLVELADLMIWVLDPQKYADAAVHRRFLVPLAGHSEVLAVVLNQSDLLTPEQLEDCVNDLRRLLDSEELHDVQIVVTSAATGAGLDTLLTLLADTVSARKAATARIAADVDGVVTRFLPFAGAESGPFTAAGRQAGAGGGRVGRQPGDESADSTTVARILGGAPSRLAAAFARAAGVSAIGDALQSARELRAVDYVGWPVTWLIDRIVHRDPVRKIRLGRLWSELRGVTAGPSGAQKSEIDNALTELADEVSPALPKPWSNTIRTAIRSRADEIPAALGERIGAALPAENNIPPWWRAIGVWQGLLLGGSVVALAWIAVILVFGVFHAGMVPHLFRAVGLLPVLVLFIAAAMVLGWLTANSCLKAVRAAAALENEQVTEDMQGRMASVAQELVVVPAQQELAELDRFRAELRAAFGHTS
jgi:50S ribosome-binding GTPase